MDAKTLGHWGEEYATKYLRKKHWQIVKRNYRGHRGEIDIIAKEGDVLVFVEVKTRRSTRYGRPCEAVTREKLYHIKKAIFQYCQDAVIEPIRLRIDVIEVFVTKEQVAINHIKGVD